MIFSLKNPFFRRLRRLFFLLPSFSPVPALLCFFFRDFSCHDLIRKAPLRTDLGQIGGAFLIKDQNHFLTHGSAEGKIDPMLDLEAEMELRAHIWPFDSTHEYFDP